MFWYILNTFLNDSDHFSFCMLKLFDHNVSKYIIIVYYNNITGVWCVNYFSTVKFWKFKKKFNGFFSVIIIIVIIFIFWHKKFIFFQKCRHFLTDPGTNTKASDHSQKNFEQAKPWKLWRKKFVRSTYKRLNF